MSGGAVSTTQLEGIAGRLGWNGMVLHRPGAGLSRSSPDAGGTLVTAVRQLDVLGQTEVVVVQGGEADAGGSAAEFEVATTHLATVNETLRKVARERRSTTST